MSKHIRTVLTGLIVAASCVAVSAQTTRVRGTITKVDGNLLTLKSTEGAELKLRLAENAMIVAIVKASVADIKEGTFLGSAAVPQADGSQKALEVHIFPEQMRGTGEGHRPFTPVPSGTMTNGATFGAMVTGVDCSTIVVKYKGGEKKIVVGPQVPVVRYEIGGPGDLEAGAHFTVTAATQGAGGALEASRINVGRDGVVPQ